MGLTLSGDYRRPLSEVQRDGVKELTDLIAAQSEALATMYEEGLERNLRVDEVLVTIYEEVIGG